MSDPARLRNYLAAAHFSTDHESGQFDLFVVGVPKPVRLLMALLAAVAVPMRRSFPRSLSEWTRRARPAS